MASAPWCACYRVWAGGGGLVIGVRAGPWWGGGVLGLVEGLLWWPTLSQALVVAAAWFEHQDLAGRAAVRNALLMSGKFARGVCAACQRCCGGGL